MSRENRRRFLQETSFGVAAAAWNLSSTTRAAGANERKSLSNGFQQTVGTL